MSIPPYVQALTALRGMAAWWIVLYHFREVAPGMDDFLIRNFIAHGYLAVDLFFILSGYVISLNYHAHFERFSWRAYVRFLWIRLARIYPLHLVILLVYLANPIAIKLFSTQKLILQRYEWSYYVFSLLLVQNWGFTSAPAWNVPAWSISTEWFAYLVFPAIWIVARTCKRPWQIGFAIALVLAAIAGVGQASGGLGGEIARLGLPRCVLEFTLGVLVFVASHRIHPCLGNRLFLISALIAMTMPVFHVADYLAAPLASMLLAAATLDDRGLAARALNQQALVWLGEISYSTYLVHFFVRDWVKFLIFTSDARANLAFTLYILIVLITSPILYYFVEKPGRLFLRSMFKTNPESDKALTA